MYDDVLLPVAIGDAEGNPAVERAFDLAAQSDATLHLLSVVDPTVYDPMTPETGEIHEALREGAEETVEAVADRARDAGLDVETRISNGAPHTVITEYAAGNGEGGVDVVVMRLTAARGSSTRCWGV